MVSQQGVLFFPDFSLSRQPGTARGTGPVSFHAAGAVTEPGPALRRDQACEKDPKF